MNASFVKLLFLLNLIVALASCAHSSSTEEEVMRPEKFEFESTAPVPVGFLAPIAIVYQLGSRSAGSSSPSLWGKCQVIETDEAGKQVGEEYPCPETYVEVKKLGESEGYKAWVNSDGKFEIPIEKSNQYKLKAVCERYSLASHEIQVSRPGKVTLTIHRKKRNL